MISNGVPHLGGDGDHLSHEDGAVPEGGDGRQEPIGDGEGE